MDQPECAELLLAAGAELGLRNQLGETAGALATRLRLPNVGRLLRTAQRRSECLAAVRSAMAPWWPLGVDRVTLAAAIQAAEQAGVESAMLQPARALLAEREEEAAAPGDWMHSALRLVGVNVGAAGLGPRDAEMDQVPEAATV